MRLVSPEHWRLVHYLNLYLLRLDLVIDEFCAWKACNRDVCSGSLFSTILKNFIDRIRFMSKEDFNLDVLQPYKSTVITNSTLRLVNDCLESKFHCEWIASISEAKEIVFATSATFGVESILLLLLHEFKNDIYMWSTTNMWLLVARQQIYAIARCMATTMRFLGAWQQSFVFYRCISSRIRFLGALFQEFVF